MRHPCFSIAYRFLPIFGNTLLIFDLTHILYEGLGDNLTEFTVVRPNKFCMGYDECARRSSKVLINRLSDL